MKNYEQRMHENGIGDVYGYDAVYRLTYAKFNVPDPTAENPTGFDREKSIVLDHVDNITRIEETKNGETSQITTEIPPDTDFLKLNQYSRFDQWGLSYDKNGNLTQKSTQKMYFDFRNQAVRVTDGIATTENKYDALGRRLQKIINTISQSYTENFYHSGHQVIEVRDGNDQVKRQFIYGNGIDEVVRMDASSGSTVTPYYFHSNAIGSTTAVTDADGNVVERYKYGLYGMPTFMDAAGNEIPNSTIGNNILFQGREYEPETNFYYFRARHYDPIMGRFLSTDPIGYRDSMNPYQAFNQNPVNFVDPFGLETREELYDKILEYYKEEARQLHTGEDDYQKRKHYFEYLIEKYGTTKMNETQLQEHYYNLIGENVEIEKEESFILIKKIWSTIKKVYNYLPGKAKKGGKRLWTKHLDERKEVDEEYKPVFGFLDDQYKAGCEYVGETTGDIAESITEEVQLTAAVGVTAKGLQKAGKLRKVRLEKKLYGSKKHGINWKEGPARAKKWRKPQGKFGSELDLDFVLSKADEIGPGQIGVFDLPTGHTCVVYMPDGSVVKATKVWVRVNKSGTVHAYPLID
ncbi:RHS repeat domain-containing protein [Acidobacteriota bacterium]